MVDRIVRPVLQTLLAVALVLSLAVTVLLNCLQGIVYSESLYQAIPDDPAFIQNMTAYVLEDLEAECLFYNLPFDKMKTAVTEERIRTLSKEYTAAVYASLCDGTKAEPITVDPTPYRTVLDSFFVSLPEEDRPMDPNAAATIARELADSTASAVTSGLMDAALIYGHRFVYGENTALRRVAAFAGWGMIILAVLTALSLIPWGGWRRRLYATAGSLFIGSALVFVPLWLLRRHDLAERLALGESPLKRYVDGILNGIVNGMTDVAAWVFAACAALLILSIVILLQRHQEKGNTK